MIINYRIKLFLIISLMSILGLCSPHQVVAAESYQQASTDYQTKYNAYRESLAVYSKARSEYIAYGTLLSQTQAMVATKDMLNRRDDLLFSYLDLLKLRLEMGKAFIPDQEYTKLIIELDTQRNALSANHPLINSAEDLEDIVKLSKKIDQIIETIVELGYYAKAQISSSKVAEFIATSADLIGVTNEQVQRINRENKLDTVQLERWLLDANQKLELAQANYNEATKIIEDTDNEQGFNRVRTRLRSSLQYIQSANSQLGEIVKSIRAN